MPVVGNVQLASGVDDSELKLLKQAIVDLQDRVRELEYTVFVDGDAEEIDPLEDGHQRFIHGIRVRREGNS